MYFRMLFVGFFLEPCRHGRNPQEEAIALFFRRYDKRNAPAAPAAVTQVPAAPAADGENELMGVFLEEAQEVLQTIRATLPACREKPDDRESLTTVRRVRSALAERAESALTSTTKGSS